MAAQKLCRDNRSNIDGDACIVDTFEPDAKHAKSRRDAMRILLAGGILASPVGGLVAHAASSSSPVPKQGGRITVASASGSATDTLDPARGSSTSDYSRAYMFYNGLTRLDEKLVPQMELAESIDNEGVSRWTIKLRKDVHFHDGKPFTSADVVYSLLRHKDPATNSIAQSVAEQMEEVKATGPHEVTIRLTSPNADFPVILGTSHFLIVKEGTTSFTTAIGTGPYKCKEFQPGVRSIAVRNTDYWKPGKPYLDEIELISIENEIARVNALLAGEVHLINQMNPRSTQRVSTTAGYAALESKVGGYNDLVMRDELGPVRNPDFVLAMKYLFDREQMRRAVFRGFAVTANDQPIPPNHRFYFAGLPQRHYDPDKAKFHLQKSGMAGATLPLVTSTAADGAVEMARLLQLAAQQIGLTLQVDQRPAGGYWTDHWMKHPLGFGNINPRPSADLMFTLFFKSNAVWNESGWKNEKFDQLLIAARAQTDEAKRKRLYADMQVLVHQHCGVGIPLFRVTVDGYNASIKGYGAHPLGGFMGFMFSERIWLEA
jgi:peptide/nickel transport system substrate-binding protein